MGFTTLSRSGRSPTNARLVVPGHVVESNRSAPTSDVPWAHPQLKAVEVSTRRAEFVVLRVVEGVVGEQLMPLWKLNLDVALESLHVGGGVHEQKRFRAGPEGSLAVDPSHIEDRSLSGRTTGSVAGHHLRRCG